MTWRAKRRVNSPQSLPRLGNLGFVFLYVGAPSRVLEFYESNAEAGFLLGGILVTSDLAGLGWRVVFFVNVPFGLAIIAAASRIMLVTLIERSSFSASRR